MATGGYHGYKARAARCRKGSWEFLFGTTQTKTSEIIYDFRIIKIAVGRTMRGLNGFIQAQELGLTGVLLRVLGILTFGEASI